MTTTRKNAPENDVMHLALASTYEIDYIITWNFTHIAQGKVIKAIEDINSRMGFTSLTICTPEELLE